MISIHSPHRGRWLLPPVNVSCFRRCHSHSLILSKTESPIFRVCPWWCLHHSPHECVEASQLIHNFRVPGSKNCPFWDSDNGTNPFSDITSKAIQSYPNMKKLGFLLIWIEQLPEGSQVQQKLDLLSGSLGWVSALLLAYQSLMYLTLISLPLKWGCTAASPTWLLQGLNDNISHNCSMNVTLLSSLIGKLWLLSCTLKHWKTPSFSFKKYRLTSVTILLINIPVVCLSINALLTKFKSSRSISSGILNSLKVMPLKRGETEKLELMVEK